MLSTKKLIKVSKSFIVLGRKFIHKLSPSVISINKNPASTFSTKFVYFYNLSSLHNFYNFPKLYIIQLMSQIFYESQLVCYGIFSCFFCVFVFKPLKSLLLLVGIFLFKVWCVISFRIYR